MTRRLFVLTAALLFGLTSSAAAQDADGDGFTVPGGDCDDGDATIAPGWEACSGVDDDCDGAVDEPGVSPFQCGSTPTMVAPVDNGASGAFVVHREKFLPQVDLTGYSIWTDVQVGATYPAGVLQNVQSILVRNWQGSGASGIEAGLLMTFPSGVTPLGWLVDLDSDGDLVRELDDEFSVTGGDLEIPGYGTGFEGLSTDHAWVVFNEAGFHSWAGGGGSDEARLLVQYDPNLFSSDVTFDLDLSSGVLRGLISCDGAEAGSTTFTQVLASANPELQDGDGDGQSACDGDCDDSDAGIWSGALEICDAIDQDCDGDVLESFDDFDADGTADCVDTDDDNDGDPDSSDCEPLDDTVHAGAPEDCDEIDSDCDGDLVDGFDDTDLDGLPDCVDPTPGGDDDDAADDDDSVVLDDDDVVLDDDDDTPPTGDDDDTETPECGCNSAPGERHAGVFALLCLVALTVRRR